jgi:hypothetical protein
MIHGPTLCTSTTQKEGWSSYTYDSAAWESFATAFSKLTPAQQTTKTKTIFSFWSKNSRHRRDRGHIKDFCFCGVQNEDWRHVLTCYGTGAIIYRTESWAELRRDLVKFSIHQDIWLAIEIGLQHFTLHPNKDDSSRPYPPFGASLHVNHIILNNAAASQTSIGWHNLLKRCISKEWSKLWAKAMGP